MVSFYMRFIWIRLRNRGTAILYFFLTVFYVKKKIVLPVIENALYRTFSSIKQKFQKGAWPKCFIQDIVQYKGKVYTTPLFQCCKVTNCSINIRNGPKLSNTFV